MNTNESEPNIIIEHCVVWCGCGNELSFDDDFCSNCLKDLGFKERRIYRGEVLESEYLEVFTD